MDSYRILGVSPFSSRMEIRAAYKKMAKKYHPDKSKNNVDGEHFLKIKDAYDYLSIRADREESIYDALKRYLFNISPKYEEIFNLVMEYHDHDERQVKKKLFNLDLLTLLNIQEKIPIYEGSSVKF